MAAALLQLGEGPVSVALCVQLGCRPQGVLNSDGHGGREVGIGMQQLESCTLCCHIVVAASHNAALVVVGVAALPPSWAEPRIAPVGVEAAVLPPSWEELSMYVSAHVTSSNAVKESDCTDLVGDGVWVGGSAARYSASNGWK